MHLLQRPLLQRPPQVMPADYSTYLILLIGGVGAVVTHLLLIGFFYWIGANLLALLNIASTAAWCLALWLNYRGQGIHAIYVMLAEIVIHVFLAVSLLGAEAGFQHYLLVAIPLIMFNRQLSGMAIAGSVGVVVLFYGLSFWWGGEIQYPYRHAELLPLFHLVNVLYGCTSASLFCLHFRNTALHAENKLQHLAATDPLTRLRNRRSITEALQANMVDQSSPSFTLVLADIDDFKQVNDQFGHHVGDEVLRQVARSLQQRVRHSDLVARWGGEEFLLLLMDADRQQAEQIIEEIRQKIASQPLDYQGRQVSVTMSFGVVQHRPNETYEQTLMRADQALYEAKRGGKNCIVSRP